MPRSLHTATLLVLVLVLAGCGGSEADSPLRDGRTIYGNTCSVCHGGAGNGGVGPALDTVLLTWPTCTAQVEWVEIGSEGWSVRYGDSYGATDKPIQGGMPAHKGILTLEQIRLVAAFERVTYGGQPEAEAVEDCRIE